MTHTALWCVGRSTELPCCVAVGGAAAPPAPRRAASPRGECGEMVKYSKAVRSDRATLYAFSTPRSYRLLLFLAKAKGVTRGAAGPDQLHVSICSLCILLQECIIHRYISPHATRETVSPTLRSLGSSSCVVTGAKHASCWLAHLAPFLCASKWFGAGCARVKDALLRPPILCLDHAFFGPGTGRCR